MAAVAIAGFVIVFAVCIWWATRPQHTDHSHH
jgi:hypothetical protein